jgi:hypothetical protein
MQLSPLAKSELMPSFQFESWVGTGDLRLVARASFLRFISELTPHVIDDLWPTFWSLVTAASKDFANDLLADDADLTP